MLIQELKEILQDRIDKFLNTFFFLLLLLFVIFVSFLERHKNTKCIYEYNITQKFMKLKDEKNI